MIYIVIFLYIFIFIFSSGSDGKNLPVKQETWVQSLGWEAHHIYVYVKVTYFIYMYVYTYEKSLSVFSLYPGYIVS